MRTATLLIASLLSLYGWSQTQFEDVSSDAGIDYMGRSYGSSWGDLDGDGFMDLYLSCHYLKSDYYFTNDTQRVYMNAMGQSFSDAIYTFERGVQVDMHGGLFFDADNDGDQDLFQLTGGTRRNLLYPNEGGTHWSDIGDIAQVGYDLARGRQATTLDLDGNGLLDLVINNEMPRAAGQVNTKIVTRAFGQAFQENLLGFGEDHSDCSYVADLDGDHRSELVVMKVDGIKMFHIGLGGQLELVQEISYPNMRDLAIGDYNGDGLVDIYIARGSKSNSQVGLFNDSTLFSTHRLSASKPSTSTLFTMPGGAVFKALPAKAFEYTVHLGANFEQSGLFGPNEIELNPDQPFVQGFQEPDSTDTGYHIYLGVVGPNTWRLDVQHDGGALTCGVEVQSEGSIEILEQTDFVDPDIHVRDILLLNQGGFEFLESPQSPFERVENSLNCVNGDFDNDGDLDIYVVQSGSVINEPDIIYENDGLGNFSELVDGYGIRGAAPGVGDAVTKADFDNDGFLDLCVTHGSLSLYLDSSRVQLWKNQGNDNHWASIRLVGLESNANGFGSDVVLHAGGNTWIRHADGGVHTSSQNDSRLHFGLGAETTIDSLEVFWPSGNVDVLYDLPADSLMTIIESGSARLSDAVVEHPRRISVRGLLSDGLLESSVRQVVLYDLGGRLVARLDRQGFIKSQGSMPSGTYLIRCTDPNGHVVQLFEWRP